MPEKCHVYVRRTLKISLLNKVNYWTATPCHGSVEQNKLSAAPTCEHLLESAQGFHPAVEYCLILPEISVFIHRLVRTMLGSL